MRRMRRARGQRRRVRQRRFVIVKRAHLDFLGEIRGSVRRVEVAANYALCVGKCREKMEQSSDWRRAREWMETEIYKRVEGVEVRFLWVAFGGSHRCGNFSEDCRI